MIIALTIIITSILLYFNSVFSQLAMSALETNDKFDKLDLYKAAIPLYNIYLVYKRG